MGVAPVTVIISTYNRANLLDQTLSAILGQTTPPAQIIVVDDGSTDATPEVLARHEDRVQEMRQANAGKSVALNRAMQWVENEYVWFFDDDDIPFPNALETHLEKLQSAPWAGFTFSPQHNAISGPEGELTALRPSKLYDIDDRDLFQALLHNLFFHMQGMLIRKRCVDEIGDFREDLKRSLDREYVLRLARRFAGARIAEPTYYYRFPAGSPIVNGIPRQSAAKESQWDESRQKIFRDLYDRIRLDEYVPIALKADAPQRKVQALGLLFRIRIMAEKGLWDLAENDLRLLRQDNLLSEIDPDILQEQMCSALNTDISLVSFIRNKSASDAVIAFLDQPDAVGIRIAVGKTLYWALRRQEGPGRWYGLAKGGPLVVRAFGVGHFTRQILQKTMFRRIRSDSDTANEGHR